MYLENYKNKQTPNMCEYQTCQQCLEFAPNTNLNAIQP